MSERKPLTLEELKNAYDLSNRVGLHVLIQFDSCKCEYEGVIDHRDDDGICAVYAADEEWLKEKDYGKTWVAYAADQPFLDRSAWKPCDDCKEISYWDEKCDNCKYDDFFAHQEPCASCESKSKWEPCYSFCPTCGRPLTDAAWDMLEKRLEEIT